MRRILSQSRWVIPVLAFVHGAVLVAIVFFAVMTDYENRLYDQIVARVTTPDMGQEAQALALLKRTHAMLAPRLELFANAEYLGVRDTLFRSSDLHLIDGKGACGSFAHVLSRLLQRSGIEIRSTQMQCGESPACHILLEAKIDGKFVVLDPTFNLAFRNRDSSLASFSEVSKDWNYFKQQVPADYDPTYSYDGVRYTNWNKIPWLTPFIKQGLDVLMGEDANTVSLRAWILNVYRIWLLALIGMYLLILGMTFWVWRLRR